MKKKIVSLTLFFLVAATSVYAQSSTNYKIDKYEFGGGGGFNVDSSNYSLEGILGEVAGEQSSSNYKANTGLIFVQQSGVPPAPTFVNSSSWYNKLKLTINQPGGAPSDTKYAIAISTDAFVADTKYVQSDNTVGATLGTEDYQTYSSWGGASGFFVIGLSQNTTYTVKVKSQQGKYTESPYGPTAAVATSTSSLSFDIDIGGSSDPGETAAPYSIDFGSLTVGSVNTATNRVWIDLDTNGEAGGFVYVYDQYGGLRSTNTDYTITSATADLTSASEGFGLQGDSKTQSSGGPLDFTSPYNGASNNVGVVNTTIREIFNTTSDPVAAGRGSIMLKTKITNVTPAGSDYADTLTVIATSSF